MFWLIYVLIYLGGKSAGNWERKVCFEQRFSAYFAREHT
jgi:hypothetical protein